MPIVALAIQAGLQGYVAYSKFKTDNAAALAALNESDAAAIAVLDQHLGVDRGDANAADAEANKVLGL
jgi:hypothetical protein